MMWKTVLLFILGRCKSAITLDDWAMYERCTLYRWHSGRHTGRTNKWESRDSDFNWPPEGSAGITG